MIGAIRLFLDGMIGSLGFHSHSGLMGEHFRVDGMK
jgi:hypothetical protein